MAACGKVGCLRRAPKQAEYNVRQQGALFALAVLTFVNLLNLLDRYVASSVKPLLQEDLKLSDAESALPTTGMVFVFIVCSALTGWLSDLDLVDRRLTLSIAVLSWSLATALAGLAQNLWQLVVFRSLVGVGEAAFSTIAAPMIADFFPQHERNWVFALFSIAAPVGGAIGYAAGAVLGAQVGWRTAFMACGVPGVVAAGLVLLIEDPVRGANDIVEADSCNETEEPQKERRTSTESCVSGILCNPHWVLAVGGISANMFAVGGLAEWYNSFVVRYESVALEDAGLRLGAVTVVAGIGGTMLGSWTASYFEKRIRSAFFLVSAMYAVPGAIFCYLAVNLLHSDLISLFCLLMTEVCAFTHMAPLRAATITVVPVSLRARSSGLQILLTHVLGDVISPPLVGLISDATGSLQTGLQLCWMAFLLSGFYWWLAYRFLSPLPVSDSGSPDSRSTEKTSATV
eukprot:TRINITY_DN14644_c0_g1_i5.p1 TRINITY_DN14644_c0_g1~~TRINITY_DN14644_c0_g1_i5.p1  ORF type:complete len:458 (-),score=39.75 TRINITY_DN14644_c0_g1_i5:127-1500(-)